jgi:enoyl-[acyl-carrier protein] reductase II
MVKQQITIPLIAAGGIATGKAMLACMALGADGVQIGSRFVASHESSAHINFKNAVLDSKEGDTELTLKELTPVRLLKNEFHASVKEAYSKNASTEELAELLGRGRAKKGMFEGDLQNGELEIGQIAGIMDELLSAEQIILDLVQEFNDAQYELAKISMK